MAAVPSIGRANRVEGLAPAEADLTHALYEEYANQIFRYCLHQLGSREEAEDAVQSTFLNAFRGIQRGVVPELESAWLFKIAHNVCLSRRRSSWRRGRIESPADFEVVEELAAAPARRAEELIGLQDVLEQMPESQRRAILLREWQGLSYREIADELELSQAAVETLIFRARRALATGLEQPPGRQKRRLARALDLGNLATALKSLFVGGSAAAKIAATVAVVSATTVAAGVPVVQHRAHHNPAGTGVPARPTRAKTQHVVTWSVAAVSSRAAPASRVVARVNHAVKRRAHVTAATVAIAAVPSAAPAPEATPNAAHGKSKSPANASKASGRHGTSHDVHGKGASRSVEQASAPLVVQPSLGKSGSAKSGGLKPGDGLQKQQGGSTDPVGSVATPAVDARPAAPLQAHDPEN
ncbi:MAG: RNA polymerase sigma factor [Actinomycetota bacterium]